MSKILASIADAETYGRRQRDYGFDETATRVEQTATAARAEHAEIVAFLRSVIEGNDAAREQCESVNALWDASEKAKALLSRVGGGA